MTKEADDALKLIKIMEGYKDEDNIKRIMEFDGGRIYCFIEHKCVNAYLHQDFWEEMHVNHFECLVDALDWFEDNR